MTPPDLAVRSTVYGLLTFAGITAYDSEAPVNAQGPYVLLLGQASTEFLTKSGYGWFHDITLSAANVAPSTSGREVSEKLLNRAIAVLTTDKPGQPPKINLTDHGFHCWMVKVGSTKDTTFTGTTESVYQKLVTLTLSIESL